MQCRCPLSEAYEDLRIPKDAWPSPENLLTDNVYMSENNSGGPERIIGYRLSLQEKAYLRSGDTGSYTPSRLDESIEKKVNYLPERFEALFEDIELLNEAERLDDEKWEGELTELLDTENKGLYEKTGSDGVPYEFDLSPRQFGEQLGRMVDRLMLYPSDSPMVWIQTELAWGFIESICLGETKFWGGGDDTERRAIMELVISNIVEEHERREKKNQAEAESTQSLLAESDEVHRKIRAALEQEGVDPPTWLVLRIENSIRRFRRTGPDTEPSFAEKFTPEAIQATYKKDRLPEKHRMIELFRDDRDHLRSIEWDDLVVADIIEHIPMDEDISTRSLSELVDSDSLSAVARTGTYLAGEDELNQEDLIERPIIDLHRENGDIYTEWVWGFTTYGRGFKCYTQLPETILQSPFEDIFSYNAIEAASDELNKRD